MAPTFTDDEVEKCRAAMALPAPLSVLRDLAAGRMVVQHSHDKRDLLIVSYRGRKVEDPERPGEPMLLAGSWPLYRAGMIDEFCLVTDAGRRALDGSTR